MLIDFLTFFEGSTPSYVAHNSITIVVIFVFWKLGIRSKNRLIWRDRSHRPLAGAPFKAGAKLCIDLATEIGTRGNRTWDLERSTLQDPKPTNRPTRTTLVMLKKKKKIIYKYQQYPKQHRDAWIWNFHLIHKIYTFLRYYYNLYLIIKHEFTLP